MLLKILAKIRSFYLHTLRPRYAEDIHTEYYFDDETWEKIKNFPRREKVTWYIITPANFKYIKHNLGTELGKEELSKIMAERARYMKEHGFELELHVHFWQYKSMPTPKKRKLIKEAVKWGGENNLNFKKLTLGWRSVDKDLPRLCEEFGLEIKDSAKFTHDFEL